MGNGRRPRGARGTVVDVRPLSVGARLGPQLLVLLLLAGCATTSAVGTSGAVYEVSVHSVNGRVTAANGPAGYPACTVLVGNQAARVWLAANPPRSEPSPPLFSVSEEALRAGILVETSWEAAVVHEVSDDELAAEAAVVYVPYGGGFHTVELRFRRVVGPNIAKK